MRIMFKLCFSGGYLLNRTEIINLSGFCNEGYEGIACSSCAPGYAKFGSNFLEY